MDKPKADHTGEVWRNRRITGPGTIRTAACGKSHWTWRWICLDCGAQGEISDWRILRQSSHLCDRAGSWSPSCGRGETIPYIPPPPKPPDPAKICSEQCRKCGHSYKGGPIFCEYILDTGKIRPKVDLSSERCPVRDVNFKRPLVVLTFSDEAE